MIGLPRDQWDEMTLALAGLIAALSKWREAGRLKELVATLEAEIAVLTERVRLLEREKDDLEEERDKLVERLAVRRSLHLGG